MSVGSRCTLATSPAELVLTEAARHVVAALVLLDLTAARGTEGNVVFVLIGPAFKLTLQGFFTSDRLAMPFVSAIETDFGFAGRTLQLSGISVLGLNMCITARFSAPAD